MEKPAAPKKLQHSDPKAKECTHRKATPATHLIPQPKKREHPPTTGRQICFQEITKADPNPLQQIASSTKRRPAKGPKFSTASPRNSLRMQLQTECNFASARKYATKNRFQAKDPIFALCLYCGAQPLFHHRQHQHLTQDTDREYAYRPPIGPEIKAKIHQISKCIHKMTYNHPNAPAAAIG
ncbi:hypothetical protein Nepgr_011586 [Nepenthes gracilis]|uniref:Uncharacterized protein n=1 Tax=Nepenthes gracilis TaxID=150966 RepID=A0AAD3SFE8_NEPGR|nr:hypothetical protein Nepgr_011586 [Nepenthes gracilis]